MKPDLAVPTAETMPDWWDPKCPPVKLDDQHVYRGKDGRWYRADGQIVSRKERRKAGLR